MHRWLAACGVTAGGLVTSAIAEQSPPDRFKGRLEVEGELQQVLVLFRHGARTPLTNHFWAGTAWDVCDKTEAPSAACLVPIDVTGTDGELPPRASDWDHASASDSKPLPGGCRKGQLTDVGLRQALELGGWLRQRYSRFLPAEYSPELLEARTTNFQRTKATMQGVLTGLFPGGAAPVRVTAAADVDEVLFANLYRCERLKSMLKDVRAQLKTEALQAAGEDALERDIRRVMGIAPDVRMPWSELHDVMTSLTYAEKSLPKAVTPEMIDAIDAHATRQLVSIVAPHQESALGPEIIRLSMGLLLQQMVAKMKAKAATPPDAAPGPRVCLYSGHDTSLMPLLVALGQSLERWPPYASFVALELWRVEGEAFVRVLYNYEEMPMPGLGPQEYWSLTAFQRALEPYLLSDADHREECSVAYGGHDDRVYQAAGRAPADDSRGDSIL